MVNVCERVLAGSSCLSGGSVSPRVDPETFPAGSDSLVSQFCPGQIRGE